MLHMPATRLKKLVVSAALLVTIALPGAAAAAESAYTDLDTDRCQQLSAEEGMGVTLKCKGLGALPVYFQEGDLRTSLFYGTVPQRYVDEGFESFSPMNTVGKKIEWRLDAAGQPQATILRWFLDNIDPATGSADPKRRGQLLVISRVATQKDGEGCMVGFVDALANTDANALAREVADDIAPGFACGTDVPTYHGTRGDKAGEPSRHLPD